MVRSRVHFLVRALPKRGCILLIASHQVALEFCAHQAHWDLVEELLQSSSPEREFFSPLYLMRIWLRDTWELCKYSTSH